MGRVTRLYLRELGFGACSVGELLAHPCVFAIPPGLCEHWGWLWAELLQRSLPVKQTGIGNRMDYPDYSTYRHTGELELRMDQAAASTSIHKVWDCAGMCEFLVWEQA